MSGYKIVKEQPTGGGLRNFLEDEKILALVNKVIQELILIKDSLLHGVLVKYLGRRPEYEDYKKCTIVLHQQTEMWVEREELIYDGIPLGVMETTYDLKNAGAKFDLNAKVFNEQGERINK